MNRLFPRLEWLRSLGAEVFRGVGRINGFDKEVLNIRIRSRQPPGDRIVLAKHEDRGAGQSCALHGPFGRNDAGQIPQDGGAEFEMRVVGEDRLSGQRPRSGDHPFVRRAFSDSGQGAKLVIDAIAARMSVANRRQGRDRIARPRAGKEPVRPFLSELGDEMGAEKLKLEVLRQLVGLDLPDHQTISRLPGLGSIARKEELRRERVACQEGVDPLGIGLKPLLRPGRKRRKAPLGLTVEAEGANELVDGQKIGAPDLGHAPLADTAQDVHLEHPFARMQVAERARRVVHRARKDVWDAIGVAPHPRFGREARATFRSPNRPAWRDRTDRRRRAPRRRQARAPNSPPI